MCSFCLRKKDAHIRKVPLNPVPTGAPFEVVYLDMVGPLIKSEGFAYIIVFICAMTKYMEVRPMETLEAKEAARAFFLR